MAPLTTSATPVVIDALIAAARSRLPGNVLVHDGYGNTEDPGDYLCVGVEDPDQPGAATSATASQAWTYVGAESRDEQGEITCAAMAWNGDSTEEGQKAARDAVYTIVAALETALRADPSVGLPSPGWTGLGSRMQLNQGQSDEGSMAQVTFSVEYRARLNRIQETA